MVPGAAYAEREREAREPSPGTAPQTADDPHRGCTARTRGPPEATVARCARRARRAPPGPPAADLGARFRARSVHPRKAPKGRHDGWPRLRLRSRQVEAIRPFAAIARIPQAGQILLPDRMRWIEVTSQAEPDIEIGVVEQGACE